MKSAIRCFCFCIIAVFLIDRAAWILHEKSGANAIEPFYKEEKDSIDVLLCGPSSAYYGISPYGLWGEHGIVSWNIAIGGQPLPSTYYTIKQALNFQTPKVIVVDVLNIYGTSKLGIVGHNTLDWMPWNGDKLKAIYELTTKEERKEYFCTLLAFHGRWKELTKDDFKSIRTLNRGGGFMFGNEEAKDFVTFPVIDASLCEELNPEVETYLYRIIDLCKERDIKLVLIHMPYYSVGETRYGDGIYLQKLYNQVGKIAEKEEVGYIDFLHAFSEDDFSYSEDMHDFVHCNPKGNQKVTEYLGEYLKSHYDLPDKRNDEEYEDWNIGYQEYVEYLQKNEAQLQKKTSGK